MDNKQRSLLEQIEGLKPVEPGALAEFEREMTQNVIPEVTRVVEERRVLADESRHRKLEILVVPSPEGCD